jgi:hypothetical protein
MCIGPRLLFRFAGVTRDDHANHPLSSDAVVDTWHGVVRLHADKRSDPASRHVAAATPIGLID